MKHAILHVGLVLLLTACGSSDGGSPAPGSGGSSGAGGGSGNGGSASGGASGAGGSSAGGASSGGAAGGGGSGDKHVGDPCTTDSECPAVGLTTPSCMKTWPGGGACTATGCAGSDLQCADSAVCANYMGENRCIAFCVSDASCRTGYKCSPDFSACIPAN